MVDRKISNGMELIEFVIFVMLHVIYAFIVPESHMGFEVLGYALVTSLAAAISLYGIKKLMPSQICFIICIMMATYLIGTRMETLAFGVCIYMVSGALISIIGSMKLNLYYIIIVNISIVFGLVTQYDLIIDKVSFGYYVLMILFCEAALITECMMGMFCQQKVEEMKTQNDLLNVAQKSKDEFLANMSHEIRTPMNAIVGMSELIMREEGATDKIKECCYNIQTSGENLLAIINDILDFSKIESGKMDIIDEPYSIGSVIQDVANTAILRKGYKDIDIIIDASPKLPKELLGDVLRNRQILLNIVNNAVKFTETGFIFISVSCYEKDGENWLKMMVQDTGIGIKEEDQDNLFESFNRVDTKRNRSIEGTGLGLALCKRLTQAMHGTIHLESKYGIGTTVTVEIPQPVEDSSPFLMIKEKENMRVAFFGDMYNYGRHGDAQYRNMVMGLWDDLQMNSLIVHDFDEMYQLVENNEVTHVFTGVSEYTDHQDEFSQMSKKVKVFVVYNPQYPEKLGRHIYGIPAPFYSISMVTALNGESFYKQYIDEGEIQISFLAPEASVLVVDDNEINLRVAEGVLKLYGINIVLARSGKEAIELLKEQTIDLVFMDHMMPEMDGIETVKIIRRIGGEYEKNLPIIALTANVVNDAKNMFLENGFQDFLPKPIALKSMDSILRKWMPEEKMKWLTEEELEIGLSGVLRQAQWDGQELSDEMEEEPFSYMQINEETALSNMGGQKDLFQELLEYCLEMEEERWRDIQKAFEQENFKEYEILVHALKGGMRSLGVEELAMTAQEQEFACKEGNFEKVKANHEFLHREYIRAHRSIEEFLKRYAM